MNDRLTSVCRICGKEIRTVQEFDDFNSETPAHKRCVLAQEVDELKLVCLFLARRVIALEQMRGFRVGVCRGKINTEVLP